MSPVRVTRLSPQERLALIEQLWDSLGDADIGLTPAQQDELDRRLAALEEDRGAAVTWQELRTEMQERTSK